MWKGCTQPQSSEVVTVVLSWLGESSLEMVSAKRESLLTQGNITKEKWETLLEGENSHLGRESFTSFITASDLLITQGFLIIGEGQLSPIVYTVFTWVCENKSLSDNAFIDAVDFTISLSDNLVDITISQTDDAVYITLSLSNDAVDVPISILS